MLFGRLPLGHAGVRLILHRLEGYVHLRLLHVKAGDGDAGHAGGGQLSLLSSP